MKSKKILNIKSLIIVLTFFCLIFMWLYFTFWRVSVDHKATAVCEARIQKMLSKGSSIPVSENGLFDYEKAVNNISPAKLKQADTFLEKARTGIDEKNKVEFQKLKNELAPALTEVDKGFRKPNIYVSFNYYNPRHKKKSLLSLVSLSRFLEALSIYEGEMGNYKAAAKDNLSVIWLGTGFGKEGIIGKAKLALQMVNGNLDNLLSMLQTKNPDAETCRFIVRELERCDKNFFSYREIIDGAYNAELNFFTYLKSDRKILNRICLDKVPVTVTSDILLKMPRKPVIEREKRIYQNWYLSHLDSASKPFSIAVKEMDDYKLPNYSLLFTAYSYLDDNALQYAYYTRSLIRLRGVMVLAALEAYKTDKGGYPESLSKLVPEYLTVVPKDPGSGGKGFYYTKTSKGPLLYSMGVDGKDDGATIESTRYDRNGDIIFLSPDIISKNRQKSR